METTLIGYVAKNKEILINASDLVSFLLVTPEISKFMSRGLAKRYKYIFAAFFVAIPCFSGAFSIYFFLQGETMLALFLATGFVFYAIFLPGMLREHWKLFTEDSVPIVQSSLRKQMFAFGFVLFGLSRAIGILSVIATE